jgi:hypothetical protein
VCVCVCSSTPVCVNWKTSCSGHAPRSSRLRRDEGGSTTGFMRLQLDTSPKRTLRALLTLPILITRIRRRQRVLRGPHEPRVLTERAARAASAHECFECMHRNISVTDGGSKRNENRCFEYCVPYRQMQPSARSDRYLCIHPYILSLLLVSITIHKNTYVHTYRRTYMHTHTSNLEMSEIR